MWLAFWKTLSVRLLPISSVDNQHITAGSAESPTDEPSGRQKQAREFFQDVPWGQVPSHRLGTLSHVSNIPRIGLCGGAPKMSKLSQMRAKRQVQSESSDPAQSSQKNPSSVLNLLESLSLSEDSVSQTETSAVKASSLAESMTPKQKLSFRSRKPDHEPAQKIEEKPNEDCDMLPIAVPDAAPRWTPTPFAIVLCRNGESSNFHGSRKEDITLETSPVLDPEPLRFQVPYLSSESFRKANPFSRPSPDDIVLAAQSKGALKGLN